MVYLSQRTFSLVLRSDDGEGTANVCKLVMIHSPLALHQKRSRHVNRFQKSNCEKMTHRTPSTDCCPQIVGRSLYRLQQPRADVLMLIAHLWLARANNNSRYRISNISLQAPSVTGASHCTSARVGPCCFSPRPQISIGV